MSERLTNEEISNMLNSFNAFMANEDMVKHGKRIVEIIRTKPYHAIYEYVSELLHGHSVHHACYHPERMQFYGDIFKADAIEAYLKDIQSQNNL